MTNFSRFPFPFQFRSFHIIFHRLFYCLIKCHLPILYVDWIPDSLVLYIFILLRNAVYSVIGYCLLIVLLLYNICSVSLLGITILSCLYHDLLSINLLILLLLSRLDTTLMPTSHNLGLNLLSLVLYTYILYFSIYIHSDTCKIS